MRTPALAASPDRNPLHRLIRRTSTFVLTVVVSTALLLYGLVSPAGAATRTFAGLGLTGTGQGYLLVSSAGEFYAYGTAHPQPNATGSSGIVGVAITADGQGALAVSNSGQFYAYGTAHPQPNPTGFTGTMVGVKLTADGQGLTAMSSTGQIYAYGTSAWLGNGDPGTPSTTTTTTTTSASQLAQQILNLRAAGKIRIADYSENPSRDSADRSLASQQLQDIAAGQPARLSTRCFPAGQTPAPVQPDIHEMQFLADLGQQNAYTLNTLFGQCHTSTSSLHYKGKAADFACGLSTGAADSVAAKYGVKRNYETCSANHHWHYSVGGA